MTSPYPITGHRELRPSFRLSAMRQRRDPLTAGLDETLVYRLGSQYVIGDVDPAEADAVSVVDVREEAPITVRGVRSYLGPAYERIDITVTGVFHCTVVDPATVVEARRTFPVGHLHRYLAVGFQAGEGFAYRPGAEVALGRVITTWLTSNPSPAPIPGMRVVFASVEVGQPRYADA